MENRFLENKIILKYCKDYFRIVNEEFTESDYVTGKVIQIYQKFIFSINTRDKNQLKKATALNTAVARYIDDREFKTILSNNLKTLKVSKKVDNLIEFIAEDIIKEYNKYAEGYTRNLYISKWI